MPQASYAVPASNRQIADELVIGVETVKTHMRALFEAFDLGALPQHQKRAALAQRALETRARLALRVRRRAPRDAQGARLRTRGSCAPGVRERGVERGAVVRRALAPVGRGEVRADEKRPVA